MLPDQTSPGSEIFTTKDMYRADRLAISVGMSSLSLMENAGRAVAKRIIDNWAPGEVAIMCGKGNNGGDGFVIARYLSEAGWRVRLGLYDKNGFKALCGDAKKMSDGWSGDVHNLDARLLDGVSLIVDAIFGAGISRPVSGHVKELLQAADNSGVPIVAVDLPSGVNGDTGEILGFAPRCHSTVTFFRPKLGHFLGPGADKIGNLFVEDIGIPETLISNFDCKVFHNKPESWGIDFPSPGPVTNKFDRGHLTIVGGKKMTGAARLAARGGIRAGAGLVTIASPKKAVPIYALDWPEFIIKEVSNFTNLRIYIKTKKVSALVIGPGLGISSRARRLIINCVRVGLPVVLDADAISNFADEPNKLFNETLVGNALLTPHEGEFRRIFNLKGSNLSRAIEAARLSGAIVLLKGAKTVIAAPDGRAAINDNAPPWLATAGSGDVLAGMIGAIVAQGLPSFESACMATWLHGAAANQIGPGLIASDLPSCLPAEIAKLELVKSK